MAVSVNSPSLNNPIRTDVPAIQQKEAALLKMDPTNVSDLEVGAKRLTEISSGNWQFQMWNGSQWVNVGKLQMDVDTVDSYHASITPKANTVAVRGSDGKLQDSITGNAATADYAVTLSETLVVGKGGTGATTAEQARSNLDVPPTSHASANTTYGISSESVYGHAKASSDAPAQDTDAGAVGIKVSEFARGDHSHKKVLGNASTYGQVKLTDSISDGSDASSSVAASAKAVKTAYDKAVVASNEANSVMTGATADAAGTSGNVPAPAAGQQDFFLRGSGHWAPVPALFKGAIISYSGQFQDKNPKVDDVIYTDWAICDGTNGTPNLIDKFIRGTDTNGIGTTGGSDFRDVSIPITGTVSGLSVGATTLTIDQMPSHNHSMSFGTSSEDTYMYILDEGPGRYSYPVTNYSGGSQPHTHSISGTGTISGTSSATVNTIPSYYALAYIMKIL